MSDRLTAEARAEVDRYLDEVRAVLRGSPLDLDEIEADLRDHLREAAAAAGQGELGRAEVEEVLDRLGPPSRWLAGMESTTESTTESAGGTTATAGGTRPMMGAGGLAADRLPWLVFALTIVGLGVFPWVGPLGLVPAWLLGRAVATRTPARGEAPAGDGWAGAAARPWLVQPVLILGSVALIALLLLWPVGLLLESGSRLGDGVGRWAPLLGGLGLWWTLVGIAVRRWTGAFGWLLRPIRPARVHGTWLALIGLASVLGGLTLYLLTVAETDLLMTRHLARGSRAARSSSLPPSRPVVAGAVRLFTVLGMTLAPIGASALCGQEAGPPAGSLADWVGRYEFTASAGERSMEGVLELVAAGGEAGLGGQLRLGSLPPAEVTGARVADPSAPETLALDLRLPEGPASAEITLTDDEALTGEIRVGPNVIPIRGTRVRRGAPPEIDAFLAAVRSGVEAVAVQALEREGEPGLAVAAVEDGERWTAGFGTREMGTDLPVTPATLFQVGSMSKMLTAWGVMRLVDEGRLELDAPANRYLTRWRVPSGEFDASGVTVRRLLSHTAGVNVPSISGVDTTETVPGIVEELEGRGRGDEWRVHIVQEPGTGFTYSGGGYMVLQLLVEEVAGRPFADYMRDEVLRPLGMESSTFGWNATVAGRVATPHGDVDERNRRHRLFAGVAGAGLYTSADDLAAFLAAHWEGPGGEPPGRGVVAPATLALMTSPDPTARSYGLGYEIYPLPDGSTAAGHGGSNVGWKANLIVVPGERIGFAVVSNDDEGRARAEVLNVVRDVLARMP